MFIIHRHTTGPNSVFQFLFFFFPFFLHASEECWGQSAGIWGYTDGDHYDDDDDDERTASRIARLEIRASQPIRLLTRTANTDDLSGTCVLVF